MASLTVAACALNTIFIYLFYRSIQEWTNLLKEIKAPIPYPVQSRTEIVVPNHSTEMIIFNSAVKE